MMHQWIDPSSCYKHFRLHEIDKFIEKTLENHLDRTPQMDLRKPVNDFKLSFKEINDGPVVERKAHFRTITYNYNPDDHTER